MKGFAYVAVGLIVGYVAWRYWSGDDESDHAQDISDVWASWTDEGVIDMDQNSAAFLSMIAAAEGTDRKAEPYRVLYGFGRAESLEDHPGMLGWPGVKLPDEMCRGAGLNPGCVSTAAGRYQITKPTWRRLVAKLGREVLPDFGPASQDRAALELIAEKGALGDVQAGRVLDAVGKVRKVWASLPGAGYAGQNERSASYVLSMFQRAGGIVAA